MVDCGWERRLEEASKESSIPVAVIEEEIRRAALERSAHAMKAPVSFRRDVLYIIGTKPS